MRKNLAAAITDKQSSSWSTHNQLSALTIAACQYCDDFVVECVCVCVCVSVMWSKTDGFRTRPRPVSDQKISLCLLSLAGLML